MMQGSLLLLLMMQGSLLAGWLAGCGEASSQANAAKASARGGAVGGGGCGRPARRRGRRRQPLATTSQLPLPLRGRTPGASCARSKGALGTPRCRAGIEQGA
jgi:hypothetical protein